MELEFNAEADLAVEISLKAAFCANGHDIEQSEFEAECDGDEAEDGGELCQRHAAGFIRTNLNVVCRIGAA